MTLTNEVWSEPIRHSRHRRLSGKAGVLLELQDAGFRVPEFVVSPTRIEDAVAKLRTPLVVRSSASVEDGVTASFAGQFESFLNLKTVEQVSSAVAKCRASLDQPAVLRYCRQQRIAP